MLDMRDQMIEARVWQEFIEGIEPSRAGHLQRTIEETMSEVEKSPAMIEVIREDKPHLPTPSPPYRRENARMHHHRQALK